MTRKVRFHEDQTFARADRPTLHYAAGSVHELKDDHAKRWVSRGMAEYVRVEPPEAPIPVEQATDVNDVASPPDVVGADSGSDGERPEPVAAAVQPRRRGRPPGSRNK